MVLPNPTQAAQSSRTVPIASRISITGKVLAAQSHGAGEGRSFVLELINIGQKDDTNPRPQTIVLRLGTNLSSSLKAGGKGLRNIRARPIFKSGTFLKNPFRKRETMSETIPESITEKIIAEKILEWENKKKSGGTLSAQIGEYSFIAISRDYGCGEEKLVPLIEKTFQWKVYGRNLLDHIAERDSLSRDFIETLDEQRESQLDQWVNYLVKSGTLLPSEYILKISKMMKVIVSHENAIFLGRGANYVLGDKPQGVRVKFTAPFEYRVEAIATLKGISQKDAENRVRKTDAERLDYLRQHFKKEKEEMSDFDVVLNTETIPPENICDILSQWVEIKKSAAS